MNIEKKDRNKLIVKTVKKRKHSLAEIAKMFGLKSKSGIHEIYQREVLGIRRKKKRSGLSTGR